MNIASVKTNPGQQEYLLKEDDKTVLKLKYKEEVHTVRIETENERRVLIIEDEGLLRTRLVLKNEYGVRIGSLNYDNFSATHGSVDIENNKFRFNVKEEAAKTELQIFKGSRKALIYSCELTFEDKKAKAVKHALASLIISVTWYLFLKGASKTRHAFNEAIIL